MKQFPLADYRVRGALRVGGLCQVYQAEKLDGTSPGLVLKQLLPLFAADAQLVERWLAKAQENAQVDHPGCVRVLDWGWADGTAHVVLPEVSGVGLKPLLRGVHAAGGSVPVDVAVGVARSILESLAQGHERFPALSHLDVSPYSVIVRPDGQLVLTEFGMWSALEPADAARIRFDRGRSQYLAPELAWSSAGDLRSDVFSCGALLYELLVGERPFQGATQLVIAMAIAEGKRKPIRDHERGRTLSPTLCDIVEHMLAREPADRFQNARAALNALTATHPLDGSERRKLVELGALAVAGAHDAGSSRLPSPVPPRSTPKTTFFPARNASTSATGDSSGTIDALRATPAPPPPDMGGSTRPPASTPLTGFSAVPRAPAEPPTLPHVAPVRSASVDPSPYEPASSTPVAPPWVAPPPLVASAPPAGIGLPSPPGLLSAPTPAWVVPASAPPYDPQPSQASPVRPADLSSPPPAFIASAHVAQPWQVPPTAVPDPVAAQPADRLAQPAAKETQVPSFEPLPVMARNEERWRDPSHTLFQMKNYAGNDAPRARTKMPLGVAVLLAVVFSFAVVTGGYLVFRLMQ